MQFPRPSLAISRCLLGDPVRYDGATKPHSPTQALAACFTLVAVCPEVEAGMSTPRPPIDLVWIDADWRVIDRASGVDHTQRLRDLATRRLSVLRSACQGAVLKLRSPSCGLASAARYNGETLLDRAGDGAFAHAAREAWTAPTLVGESTLETLSGRRQFFNAVWLNWAEAQAEEPLASAFETWAGQPLRGLVGDDSALALAISELKPLDGPAAVADAWRAYCDRLADGPNIA